MSWPTELFVTTINTITQKIYTMFLVIDGAANQL